MTHSLRILLPKNVQEALSIYKKVGNDHWYKALNKEISKVKVAWKRVDGVTPDQAKLGYVKEMVGNQEISCNIIVDVHMDFQQKARFVAGGHMPEAPTSISYFIAVSHDSIHIGFLIAYPHGVYITDIYIQNTYLNAPCAEKIWFVSGDESREDKVRVILIVRALYGLKYAGLLWRSALALEFFGNWFKATGGRPKILYQGGNEAGWV